jgi:hypothetical protein
MLLRRPLLLLSLYTASVACEDDDHLKGIGLISKIGDSFGVIGNVLGVISFITQAHHRPEAKGTIIRIGVNGEENKKMTLLLSLRYQPWLLLIKG